MKALFSLQDKTIWVIGGAGYLGSSIVVSLVKQGCRVVCADIEGRASELGQKIGFQESFIAVDLDVRSEEDICDFVREKTSEIGIPDGLVVLTYGASGKKLEELTGQDFDLASQLGVTATFLLAREVGERMKEIAAGSIVLFSSMYGMVSPDPCIYEPPMNTNPIEYGVGKAGIIQMTKYLAVHWAGSGIRVNCISPGPFPNAKVQRNFPDFIDRLAKKVPLGRVGMADEIAGPVLFLLSQGSSFVTGHNLVVDGGWTVY